VAEQPIGMTIPTQDSGEQTPEGAPEPSAAAQARQPDEDTGPVRFDSAKPVEPSLSRYARASVVRPKGAGPGAQPSLIQVDPIETRNGEAAPPIPKATTRPYAPIEVEHQIESVDAVPAEAEPQRVPFWKRIAMPRSSHAEAKATPPPRPNLDPVLARLKQLEEAMMTHQAATLGRLDAFEDNITRLWELEEQMALTEVRERLALLEANQEEIADGLHSVSRNLSVLAVVIALAVAGGLFGISILI
jgi:hypothetical protein